MDRKNIKYLKELAYYSSLGFSVAIAIFIGLFIGLFLDKQFGKSPVFTLIFLGFGIAAGFRNLFIAMKKSKKL